jgi:hypothetical protein
MFTIGAYISGVARDRAADRGCTGGGKVAGLRKPARRNSGRVFVFAAAPACRLIASPSGGLELGKSAAFGITVRPPLNLGSAEGD